MSLQSPVPCSLTWWGHATTTIEIAGVRILTDPLLTQRVALLSRVGGPVPGVEARRADLVLISHLHADHLHVRSLRQLPLSAQVIAPRGSGPLLRRAGVDSRRVHEVDVDDTTTVEGLTIRAVPTVHDGRRHPGSRLRGPALGYVIDAGGTTIWFAGDTELFESMVDVGPVDLAVIPIGGWGPTLGRGHLDPDQAAAAVRRVQARYVVPVHYGTYWPIGLRHLHRASFRRLFEQPAGRFVSAMADSPTESLRLVGIGTTTRWTGL